MCALTTSTPLFSVSPPDVEPYFRDLLSLRHQSITGLQQWGQVMVLSHCMFHFIPKVLGGGGVEVRTVFHTKLENHFFIVWNIMCRSMKIYLYLRWRALQCIISTYTWGNYIHSEKTSLLTLLVIAGHNNWLCQWSGIYLQKLTNWGCKANTNSKPWVVHSRLRMYFFCNYFWKA